MRLIHNCGHAGELLVTMLCVLAFGVFAQGRSPEDEYDYHIAYRVNAHGDEFMSLALTSDARRLVIGTEKGEVLVWGIAERQLLKRFNQGTPVHCVAALADPRYVIAVGGPHSRAKQFGIARKWDIETGTFTDWKGSRGFTYLALSVEVSTGLVAASDAMGGLVVWDSNNGAVVASIALKQTILGLILAKRTLFLTTIQPDDLEKMEVDSDHSPKNSILTFSLDQPKRPPRPIVKEIPGRLWGEMTSSPDNQMIAAQYAEPSGRHLAILELQTGREIASFQARSVAWSGNRSLILFDDEVPTELVQISADWRVSRSKLLEGGRFHGSGNPANMTGQVVSPDGAIVWEVFQLGATLAQCNLTSKECEALYQLPSLPYTMDVLERPGGAGLVATGGDDGFVRVWKLSDLSLIREFAARPGVPQGVALMPDARRVVFSFSNKNPPTEIMIGDVVSGEVKSLLTVPQPFVRVVHAAGGFIYDREQRLILADLNNGASLREFAVESKLDRFSTSPNGEWLAVANDQGTLYFYEIKTGKLVATSREKIEDLSNLTVTNDGQYVYTTEWKSALRRWNTRDNTLKELASIRGQARSLLVSSDGERIAVGGNHRDVAVYESKTGNRLAYLQTSSSDFYVTNAWVLGDRLVFTSDSGVLFAVMLERNARR